MITVALFNIFEVFCAYLARRKRAGICLVGTFILVFLFLALRYDFGNDYPAYLEKFYELNRATELDYFDPYWHFEPGWILLCRIFSPFGFFAMVAVLALVNSIAYFQFIKRYAPAKYYWLAAFLYVFSPEFMLVQSSAMRQSLAIAMFLLSIDFILRREALKYLLCIGVASFFHSSAIILFPVYLLGASDWRIGRLSAAAIFSGYLFFIIFGKLFLSNLNLLITLFFSQYETYQAGGEIGTGFGMVYYSFLFVLILAYERSQTREHALLFKISVLGFLIAPVGLLIMMVGRVGMFFQPATIVAYPVILSRIRNKGLRNMLLFSIVFMTLYSFFNFFRSEVYRDGFSSYQTIFSAPELGENAP